MVMFDCWVLWFCFHCLGLTLGVLGLGLVVPFKICGLDCLLVFELWGRLLYTLWWFVRGGFDFAAVSCITVNSVVHYICVYVICYFALVFLILGWWCCLLGLWLCLIVFSVGCLWVLVCCLCSQFVVCGWVWFGLVGLICLIGVVVIWY